MLVYVMFLAVLLEGLRCVAHADDVQPPELRLRAIYIYIYRERERDITVCITSIIVIT